MPLLSSLVIFPQNPRIGLPSTSFSSVLPNRISYINILASSNTLAKAACGIFSILVFASFFSLSLSFLESLILSESSDKPNLSAPEDSPSNRELNRPPLASLILLASILCCSNSLKAFDWSGSLGLIRPAKSSNWSLSIPIAFNWRSLLAYKEFSLITWFSLFIKYGLLFVSDFGSLLFLNVELLLQASLAEDALLSEGGEGGLLGGGGGLSLVYP